MQNDCSRFGVEILNTRYPGDARDLINFLASSVPVVEPIALLVKSEGNGCVNDFTRVMAYESYKNEFKRLGFIDVAIVVSGGTEGVLSPHATLFYKESCVNKSSYETALTIGVSRTREMRPAEIGSIEHVEMVTCAVRSALRKAEIESVKDVEFVQIKCPLLRDEDITGLRHEGVPLLTDGTYRSMGLSRGASALGSAVALEEISGVHRDDICNNWDLYSSKTSVSSGAELRHCEIVVFGNSKNVCGNLFISSALMQDPIDTNQILEVLKLQKAHHEGSNIVQIFAKADPVGIVRGNRSIMLDDSDIAATRHARAAVGGVLSSIVGRTNIYVSGGAEHQGPVGGGPVAIISKHG
jgi:cyanuric acid amidohydrolase